MRRCLGAKCRKQPRRDGARPPTARVVRAQHTRSADPTFCPFISRKLPSFNGFSFSPFCDASMRHLKALRPVVVSGTPRDHHWSQGVPPLIKKDSVNTTTAHKDFRGQSVQQRESHLSLAAHGAGAARVKNEECKESSLVYTTKHEASPTKAARASRDRRDAGISPTAIRTD
ncbi:hypothetical protein EVAR_40526_1 [Eumeta japonica]|uniref:Uncharacterized protein n=1 Tax=Eumeta variegata TaxID=151549 RepID=A0A4C1XWA7_EUMVA|nr:hypothetical protein EVAR_40526_1 [Eumeta japonica]